MKDIKDISIVVNARVNSSRVHRKILRDFCGSTLLDISLDKLSKISGNYPKFLAFCENEILQIFDRHKDKGIEILPRDKDSVERGFRDQRITFRHYKQVRTRYIMSINACLPFVKPSTYEKAIESFINSDCKTMTSVKSKNNIFFDEKKTILNYNPNVVATQNQPTMFEMAHVFHIFDKEIFLNTGKFWDYSEKNPELFLVSDEQCLDIDTLLDFNVCECIYKKYGSDISVLGDRNEI